MTLNKFPVLVSYAYAKNDEDAFARLARNPKIDLLLDSGAFTVFNTGREIKLSDYCDFIGKWQKHLFAYIALDVIGNKLDTYENLNRMIRNGYTPVPVHLRADDERRMDQLFEMSDYVCLAGLKRSGAGTPREYLAAKMKWAKGRKTHWLGYCREQLFNLGPFSVDASTWCNGVKFGSIAVYIGNGHWLKPQSVTYDKRHVLLRHKYAMSIVKSLGFSAQDVNSKAMWRNVGSGTLVQVVPADSWVRYVKDIYAHFGIMLFLVVTTDTGGMGEALSSAIDRHMGNS